MFSDEGFDFFISGDTGRIESGQSLRFSHSSSSLTVEVELELKGGVVPSGGGRRIHGAREECWSGPGLWDRGVKCGHLQLVGTQRLGRKTLGVQGWGPAGVLVCWELAD